MAIDFVSEVDKRFFADNLLLNEDWDDSLSKLDEISSFLDAESQITSTGDISLQSPDLAVSMLDENAFGGSFDAVDLSSGALGYGDPVDACDLWRELSDSSDSGLDCGMTIKDEPLSPASSNFSDGSDLISTQMPVDMFASHIKSDEEIAMDVNIKCEGSPGQPDILALSTAAALPEALSPPMNIIHVTSDDDTVMISQPTTAFTQVPLIKSCSSPSVIHTSPVALTTVGGTSPVQNDKVTQLINSKVKIQPKPITAPALPKVNLSSAANGKPLVLTAEEFAKLTAQGVLKFHPPPAKPASAPAPVASPQLTPVPTPAPTPPAAVPLTMVTQETPNMKLMKRQQRMIKNRESACQSRKRKKEYLTSLEEKLHACSDENARLKEQNSQLKRRVSDLQSENDRLRQILPLTTQPGQLKKVTCVFAVLLFISLNLGPVINVLPWQSSSEDALPVFSPEYVHHGRTLKSFTENIRENATDNTVKVGSKTFPTLEQILRSVKLDIRSSDRDQSRDLMLLNDRELFQDFSMCPSYFNSTESQRLVMELTGWVMGHKKELEKEEEQEAARKQQQQQQQKQQKRKRRNEKVYYPPTKLQAAIDPSQGELQYRAPDSDSGRYQVQVFNSAEQHYHQFMESIHRRNDTFYVVSFRRDHLLLPATAHNKTTRPRMSLVMPAVSLNATMDAPSGSIAMMQIDCEVIATKVVHVHKTAFPDSTNVSASSSSSSSDHDSEENQHGWRPPHEPRPDRH